MRLRRLPAALSAAALVALAVPAVALAKPGGLPAGDAKAIEAGYGVADATWNVGAAAGQYANENTSLAENVAGDGEVDPYQFSHIKEKSYGVQSRLSVRAIVVEGTDGHRVALLKSDNYLAQDLLLRRAGQLLGAAGSKVGYDDILHSATHNHSSPYYTTTSPGVFVFQDVFDQRMFEYEARAIRDAILDAEADLQPARMAATTVPFSAMKANVVGPATADDKTPAGYPREEGDTGLVVMRFDALGAGPTKSKGRGKGLANPRRAGDPIAVWMNFGEHPESLDGYGLTTGDYVGALERFVQRDVHAPLVFSQGDVGSAEGPYERPDTFTTLPDGTLRAFAHSGYAQMERGARLMADAVVAGFTKAATDEAQVPYASSFPVQLVTAWVPGPLSHPYPSVGNCNTGTTLNGNPGVGVAPDCERVGGPQQDNPVVSQLRLHGVPVPDQYAAPGYPAVEENTRLKLQVARFGEVLLASCACEAQVDLIKNLESRANAVSGDIYDGYDWSSSCTPAGTGYTCLGKAVTKDAYDRMVAQVHNDARGWDSPENVGKALSEPVDPKQIFGNFTKEELPAGRGFALPVGLGHSGDYNGYTVSYREYQNRESYRKALTSYGPHTADYMVTRLVRMAGALKGGPAFTLSPEETVREAADEQRQESLATVIGNASGAAYDAYRAALPADVGPVAALTQPKDLQRFGAATFSWRGGSTAVDNPVARVERQVDGVWQPYADMSGEVQTQVAFPKGVEGVADTYTGRQEWKWTAQFEAFDGFPARLGQTPAGTYRFVVDGVSRTTGTDKPYTVSSQPFQVTPWTGVTVKDAQVDPSGNVSFVVPDSDYPTSYASTFRTIKAEEPGNAKTKPICRTCAFRPWARYGAASSAVVTVTRASGAVEQVPATLTYTPGAPARFGVAATPGSTLATAALNLQPGDRAVLPAGSVQDVYGEYNGRPFALA
ncbi:MAG: hypothetical protein LC789_10690 [Actinobacteria bacterium]|nr:hypothetical protein [Actinomycetota bacterium]